MITIGDLVYIPYFSCFKEKIMAYLFDCVLFEFIFLFVFLWWFCEHYPELYANVMAYLTLFGIFFVVFMGFYQLFN